MKKSIIRFDRLKLLYSSMVLVFVIALTAAKPDIISEVNKKAEGTKSSVMTKEMQHDLSPKDALQKLKDGNQRFVNGKQIKRDLKEDMKSTAKGQYPYAIILSCVDSRTSTELVFDQGIGDVFNARIAGNFVNTDILGSMEFACKVAGSKVVLVVGHSKCGAVKGACDHVELGNLTHLIDEIEPAVENVKNIPGERNSKNDAFVQAVAIENVKLAIQEIREKSDILREMEKSGEIMIAGGMYDLESGKVEFIKE